MKNKLKTTKKSTALGWTLTVTLISFITTVAFSLISELVSNSASLILSSVVLLLLITVSIITDVIGTAFAACEQAPFVAMSSRKVKGAKQAMRLLQNNEKLCSICNDVIGDICGVVSGAATVAMVLIITGSGAGEETLRFWLSIFLSALVASMTIGGKAFGKSIAINRSKDIVLLVGVLSSVFSKKD